MIKLDLLRPSRDGDQFHYTWAARQSLRLLDESSGLHALFVEAVSPSEQPTALNLDASSADTPTSEDDNVDGNEVIDLAEYWGSSDIDHTDRVVYRQFKHSTRHADEAWTLSFLTKTLVGFARKYRSLKADHPAVLDRIQFEFITNRAPAQSALDALNDLRQGIPSTATEAIFARLVAILSPDDIADLCQRLMVDERAPSLLKLRHLLDLQVSDLLPGAPGDQALLLREMISSRPTSIAGDDPSVLRADVLASLKTSEDQLLPAPNLIEPPRRLTTRQQFVEIAAKVGEAVTVPTLVHGPGGVGKSVLAGALTHHLPSGSITIVFDCFGNGSYRRPSAPRHRPKQGFVQLVNELAGQALCDPIIPSATADETDYARTFLRRLANAAETLATTAPDGLLTIIIDAADNAAMIAAEMGERSFVHGLIRESLPQNVRLVVTSRTERIHRLGLPANYQDIPLRGFGLDETRSHLQMAYPDVPPADVSEFHARTGRNPRVQATVLDATSDISKALAWLAPNPGSPGQALDSLIERQVAEIRDRQHDSGADIDAICLGLAALRPMIPVRVLAKLAGVHESVVLSFVSDLGRPLLIDGGSVQFRDEPTETWFRDRYRPAGEDLDGLLRRLAPIADEDAYVAASLPALLFEANRFNDLVQLALSDDRLPDSALPAAQRNEIERREISQQRTHFALTAALRADRDFEAARLALRLGALTAGRTRRLDLIRDNTDLAARFLDPSVLEQLVATRSLTADWPSSNLPIEGALLAGADGQTDQARNRLRSATAWMSAWVRQARRDGSDSRVGEVDILQVTWGLLNTDGAAACIRFLRSWRPRTLAFDVGVDIARRLLDAGRLGELGELALAAQGLHLRLAIAQACSERDVDVDPAIVTHLLRPFLMGATPVQLSRHDHRPASAGDPFHDGLTAVVWLITRAVAHGITTPAEAAQILRRHLPENLGHRTGGWYDRDVWYPILGFALCARLEGRALSALDIQGSRIQEAREREKFESSRDLREYRANVEPLVSWAAAWLDLNLDPSTQTRAAFSQRASNFLQASPPKWRKERIDQTKVNIVLRLVGRALTRFPAIADHEALLAFEARNKDTISRHTLADVIRQTATQPALHQLSSQLARRCHQRLASAREDAGELATDFVRLARATYRISPDEASVHFRAALDVTDAIGDDAWARWRTLLDIAGVAGRGTSNEPGRAYRLGKIAESVEPYLGDSLYHADVLAAAAQLSLPEALATGSRWRDRRIASIENLADGISTTPAPLLNVDPLAALALLPLGHRHPDHRAVAAAVAQGPGDTALTLVSYLQFRRASPLTADALDELLTVSGVPRTAVAQVDPSLLWTARTATDAKLSDDVHSDKRPQVSFADLDFTTGDGWAEALTRRRLAHGGDDLFAYVAAVLGARPDLLRGFEACPTTSYWDLERLLESLHSQSLSMATQAALDGVVVTLLNRFAPDFLLVSWRTPDLDSVRTLTGRDTDYEHVASRALANQSSFTADQAYALAAQLGRRLDVAHVLKLFDAAASLFDDVAPVDAHDGHHPNGTTEGWEPDAAVAAVVWTALGDPAERTRWRAAHCVHLAFTMGHVGVVSRLLDLVSGRIDPGPFLDDRFEFYARHAHQWLMFGISRATAEPSAVSTAALCGPLLIQTATGTPHAVNTPLARDSLLRLHAAGAIQLAPAERSRIERLGRPIGTVRRDWHADAEELTSLSALTAPTGIRNSSSPESSGRRARAFEPPIPAPGASYSHLTDDDANTDAELNVNNTEEAPFRFFFDFRSYWCEPLGSAFGISGSSIEKLVAEVLIDHWAVPSRGLAEDDMRHTLDLYPSGNYVHKGEWPEEEDLDFYLATQALCEVAGALLESRPVVQRYEEDAEAGNSEYSQFLEWHMPSRTNGRWLSDRRDSKPWGAVIEPPDRSGIGTTSYDPHWVYRITSNRFNEELFPSPSQVVVWGFQDVQNFSRSETVSVRSALVSPSTAPALLRALQTAPDRHAYRIPDTTDEEYSSALPGFELTGWIKSHGHSRGRDRQDPYAGAGGFPPPRPTDSWPALQALAADPDYRLWRDGPSIVVVSTAWGDESDRRDTIGSTGDTLTVDRTWLASVLTKLERWLILEVEVQRRSDDTSYRVTRRAAAGEETDHFPFLEPYTKYFLIDTVGAVHEL